MELIIIFALVLLNGVFAMSEMALVSSRKFKLESAKNHGNAGAKSALELSKTPSRFLSTTQIGITLIGIILGFYSGDALTNHFAAIISKISFLAPYAKQISGPAIIIFITYLSVVFGELFPKQMGMIFPEKIAILVSRPMTILAKIASPFVWLLTSSNTLLMRLFGIKKNINSHVSEDEIKSIIRESAKGGEIDDVEQNIVERVFELGDTKASNLFTHKNNLTFFDFNDSYEEIIKKINGDPHTAYPVSENRNTDDVKGIVLIKDFFFYSKENEFNLKDFIKSPIYVSENTSAYKILENFRQSKIHFGIVIDEYGITQGMITMDDVMDALVGDMSDEEKNEYKIITKTENSWEVDGQFSLRNFSKEFPISINDDILQNIQTVGGFVTHYFKGIPTEGEKVDYENFEFEILSKDNQRIDKILVKNKTT
ncbi:hemolysin family protein [Halpernia frigidisoli]|uniref:Putative hemolysin n=1 Tax=Halpernia frigidisoli TaxID=1125876 RepID=A0A1I3D7E4_9FLAO|nr:hemolysin family protein [Halpernia frigidisoli]SFH82607.1 putative hemolysin [Halpernia frigidisoli]